jgi:predicted membrane metal-binding protein
MAAPPPTRFERRVEHWLTNTERRRARSQARRAAGMTAARLRRVRLTLALALSSYLAIVLVVALWWHGAVFPLVFSLCFAVVNAATTHSRKEWRQIVGAAPPDPVPVDTAGEASAGTVLVPEPADTAETASRPLR